MVLLEGRKLLQTVSVSTHSKKIIFTQGPSWGQFGRQYFCCIYIHQVTFCCEQGNCTLNRERKNLNLNPHVLSNFVAWEWDSLIHFLLPYTKHTWEGLPRSGKVHVPLPSVPVSLCAPNGSSISDWGWRSMRIYGDHKSTIAGSYKSCFDIIKVLAYLIVKEYFPFWLVSLISQNPRLGNEGWIVSESTVT